MEVRLAQKILRAPAMLLFLFVGYSLGQSPSVKQDAKDSACSNIVALAGSVTINCSSLTSSQRKLIDGIPAVLNKILENQLDPGAVMQKLDEILRAVNPNIPVKAYSCDGRWRTAGPGTNAAFEISMGGDDVAFQNMVRLNNGAQYRELLAFCLAQIQAVPGWLTPRLFGALAYLGIGDTENAKAMLAEFDSKTGPAYAIGGCKQASEYLHQHLR